MKISLYLTRPDVETSTSIFARINYNGNKVKFYLNESIQPKHWNAETYRAKKSLIEHPEFNHRLNSITSEIHSIYRKYLNDNNHEIPSPEKFKSILEKELKRTEIPEDRLKPFLPFFENIINQSINGGRVQPISGKPYSKGTIVVYKNTLRILMEFQAYRKRNIDFNSITIDFHTEFTEYLSKRLDSSTNTIGKHIKTIKTILNEATERGINTNLQFKSRKFSATTEQTDHIYLEENEINEMENLDLSNNKRLDNVRDLFLIACYTGLRFSDFKILKPEQMKNGFIEFKEIIKSGNPIVIPIHNVIYKILKKYNGMLPRAISNAKFNEYLKEVGKMIKSLHIPFETKITKGGIRVTNHFKKYEILSAHTARRSFATNEFKNGTPTLTIMAITGHKTEKAFLRYIKVTPTEQAQLLKSHWDKRNNLKVV
jgi:integrase